MKSDNSINKEKVNQKKLRAKYEIIKNDYFLRLLFDNLEKKRLLNILKYNKNLKKRIDISINDYREYSEQYSSIEIEIKPVNNKL